MKEITPLEATCDFNVIKDTICKIDKLQKFKEERRKQMQHDQLVREMQLSGLTQKINETKEGHRILWVKNSKKHLII